MLNIFRYLKQFKGTVCIIFVLLIAQAYCDLALPTYTSNIVDIGISNSGVEERVPNKIREGSIRDIKLFLSEEDAQLVDACYEKTNETVMSVPGMLGADAVDMVSVQMKQMQAQGAPEMSLADMAATMSEQNGGEMDIHALTGQLQQEKKEAAVYALKDGLSDEKMEQLAKAVEKPEMFYGMMNSALSASGESVSSDAEGMELSEEDMADMQSRILIILDPASTPEDRTDVLDGMLHRYESMWDTMSQSLTAMYIKGEYEAVGVDMERYQKDYLWVTGIKMLGVALGVMITMILAGLLASRVGAKVALNLRKNMFGNVMRFSNKELDQFSTASLITRSTNDIQQVQMVLVMLLRMVLYAPILGVGAVLKVIRNKTSMAWIIVVAIIAVSCLVIVLFSVAMPKFKKMQTLVDRLNQVAREILTGLPVIRAFSREKHEEERFACANENLMRTQLFTNRVMVTMMPAMMLIMYLVNVAILWFGAHGIDNGNLQVGDMIAFITYTMQIIMSFLMLTMISIMLPRAGVAAKRIDEVIAAKPEIVDAEHVKEFGEKRGEVVFDHVDFAYPDAENCVLEDITFTAKPGETTAIIGSAGSGKSTLINLIPRFFDVTNGKVTVDGLDVRDVSQEELRRMIGYVPQKGVLFSGTIESNIKFGNVDAADELMVEAAGIAQATEFIDEKRGTYSSEISQGGTNVSGGQKQRLSIARAIAKEPKIYIFDDSFSALDFKTDAALRKALAAKTKDSTVIIVAQRISTIMHAEQILVLDEGRIVGKGTHGQLLRSCEVYQQIASSQLSQAEIESTQHRDSSVIERVEQEKQIEQPKGKEEI